MSFLALLNDISGHSFELICCSLFHLGLIAQTLLVLYLTWMSRAVWKFFSVHSGRETALSDLGNLSVLGEALSFAVNIGFIAVDMHCLVKPPAFYFLQ